MLSISMIQVNLGNCFVLLLFLLPLLPLQNHLSVDADQPIDSTCKSANEYLDAMYRCRGSDFQVISFCASQRSHELNCNKSSKIAVFNASIGPSSEQLCGQAESPFSRRSSTGAINAGSECCLLSTVENECHGRQKCKLDGVELFNLSDGRLCAPRNRAAHQPPQRIMVVFICVSQQIFKELRRDDSKGPESFCDGQLVANDGHSTNGHRRTPSPMIKMVVHSTAGRILSTEISELSSPEIDESSIEQSDSTAVYGSGGKSLDWIWSLIFIKDNMDRFLIYLFLSIAVGVILVLLVVIIGLCFGRFWRRRRSEKTKEAGHMIQSSTQTNDVTTSLIASNHTPGIEMVHYAHTDSLRAIPVTRTTGNNTSMTGNSVHFASDGPPRQYTGGMENELEQPYSRNGGSTYLNVPHYQINSTRDSMDSGEERLADHDDYPSNTLGRFYTNPYRHDSYRTDGYRTLQHKQ